jgi:hypothetical protein
LAVVGRALSDDVRSYKSHANLSPAIHGNKLICLQSSTCDPFSTLVKIVAWFLLKSTINK